MGLSSLCSCRWWARSLRATVTERRNRRGQPRHRAHQDATTTIGSRRPLGALRFFCEWVDLNFLQFPSSLLRVIMMIKMSRCNDLNSRPETSRQLKRTQRLSLLAVPLAGVHWHKGPSLRCPHHSGWQVLPALSASTCQWHSTMDPAAASSAGPAGPCE
jgi:hypothetical protein